MRPFLIPRVITPTGLFKLSSVTPISSDRLPDTGASNDSYAIIVGEYFDVYSTELVRTSASPPSSGYEDRSGGYSPDYALLFGGSEWLAVRSEVVAYNETLSRSFPTALSSSRTSIAVARTGVYTLAMGGCGLSSGDYQNVVDAYDASLTRSIPTALSVARYDGAGASVGVYALIAGGKRSGEDDTVDAYNESLTRSIPSSLRYNRIEPAGASFNGYAIIAGGHTSSYNYLPSVEAYNSSLTRSALSALSVGRDTKLAVVGDYLLAIGGKTDREHFTTVDVYNTSLTRTTPSELQLDEAKFRKVAVSIGEYALGVGEDVIDGYYFNATAILGHVLKR